MIHDLYYVIRKYQASVLISASVLAAYFTMSMFTGIGIMDTNPVNQYALQSESWLNGRLDLGQDYEYLELAVYQGKYFVSFPPFPSMVLIPFVVVFGKDTPDNFLTLLAGIFAAIYAFKISRYFKKSIDASIFWSLFITIGGNLLFILSTGGVWFMAQAFCFALTMTAIYYALTDIWWHGYLSLALWAFAVGCRPFTIIFIPILLYLLYKKHKKLDWKWLIAPILIGIIYATLNIMRFGNPLEFGLNYLPEFTRSHSAVFSLAYVKSNLHNLFRLPEIAVNGRLLFPQFNGMAFWLASPIFVSSMIYLISSMIRHKAKDSLFPLGIFVLVSFNIFLLLLHKTMGGWHFGNRYTVDVLPFIFLIIMITGQKRSYHVIDYPLFILGLGLNIAGTIAIYNNWL